MKIVLILATTLLTLNTFANINFAKCDIEDIKRLEMAHTSVNFISQAVREELLPISEKCMVAKPRFILPAVCGITVPKVDTYRFIIKDLYSIEVVVDHSYVSCQRTRVLTIPSIKSFKYTDFPVLKQ